MSSTPTATRARLPESASRTAAETAELVYGPLLLALLSIASGSLWAIGLSGIEPRQINDFGTVSVMTPPMFIALASLSVGFALSLRVRPLYTPLLLLHIAVLLFMLFGIGTLIHDVPRFQTAWVHSGITEAITRTGELHPNVDARFQWPVFFILLGFLTEAAGLQNAIELAAWVPLLSNVLYLGPLLLLYSGFTADRRLVWLSVWIFFLANWVGQDYMSPQGFNYLLYLTILGILLRWFSPPVIEGIGLRERVRHWFARLRQAGLSRQMTADLGQAATGRQRAILAAIVVLLYAVVVSSHQLTPFALLAAVSALVVLRRCTLRGLPVLFAVMLGTWLSYMTVTYLAGHLPGLLEQVGDPDNLTAANVERRVAGSADHITVVYLRLATTVGVWGLAFIGGLRRLRRGYWDVAPAVLAILPFGLLGLQSYGGEMLLRVYLFALPFMAFFMAALLYPTPSVASLRRSAVVASLSVALAVLFMVARYGNERAEYQTAEEAQAMGYLHSVIEPGDLVVGLGPTNTFHTYRNFERNRPVYFSVLGEDFNGRTMARQIDDYQEGQKYVVITRSQIAGLEMFTGFAEAETRRVIAELRQLPGVETIYENRDAVIFSVGPGSQ